MIALKKSLKNLPFTLSVPDTYEEFEAMCAGREPEYQAVVVERMVKSNHPSLPDGSRQKLINLFTYCLQHLQDIGSDPDTMVCFLFYVFSWVKKENCKNANKQKPWKGPPAGCWLENYILEGRFLLFFVFRFSIFHWTRWTMFHYAHINKNDCFGISRIDSKIISCVIWVSLSHFLDGYLPKLLLFLFNFQPSSFRVLDRLAPWLYDLTQFAPAATSSVLSDVLKEKYEDFLKRPRRFPGIDTVSWKF